MAMVTITAYHEYLIAAYGLVLGTMTVLTARTFWRLRVRRDLGGHVTDHVNKV